MTAWLRVCLCIALAFTNRLFVAVFLLFCFYTHTLSNSSRPTKQFNQPKNIYVDYIFSFFPDLKQRTRRKKLLVSFQPVFRADSAMFHKLKDSFHRFIRYIKWLHMLYELNTCISMCEPWEKVFLSKLWKNQQMNQSIFACLWQ